MLTKIFYFRVIASNRDEFLSRPSLRAEWHSFDDQDKDASILSGRDIIGGGTWLGIHKGSGRFGFLTNIAQEACSTFNHSRHHQPIISRGKLLRDYLSEVHHQNLDQYLAQIQTPSEIMQGFNLVIGQFHQGKLRMGFHSNRINETVGSWESDASHSKYENAISNAMEDGTPVWEKVQLAKQLLEHRLTRDEGCDKDDDVVGKEENLIEDLFGILRYVSY